MRRKKKSQRIISFLSALQQLQEYLILGAFWAASVVKKQLSMEVCGKRALSFSPALDSLAPHAV